MVTESAKSQAVGVIVLSSHDVIRLGRADSRCRILNTVLEAPNLLLQPSPIVSVLARRPKMLCGEETRCGIVITPEATVRSILPWLKV